MNEFRLPSGEWHCTKDNVTEPCGECIACREIAEINRSGSTSTHTRRFSRGRSLPVSDVLAAWPAPDVTLTRRQYLVLTTIEQTGCDVFLAVEAVSSTAVANGWSEEFLAERDTFEGFQNDG